jgi:serine/threonine protein kinase
LLEELGEGAFATVHKARSLDTGELVAVKTITKEHLGDSEVSALLLNEI